MVLRRLPCSLRKPANAIDITLIREMHLALDRLQKPASGVRAVVIAGSGGSFCSGVDLHSVDLENPGIQQHEHLAMRRFMDPLDPAPGVFPSSDCRCRQWSSRWRRMSLALACDIIVVGEDAYFWPSFSHLGLVPDAGVTFRLSRRIGGGRSLACLLLADRIDAKTAQEWGLAYAVVPDRRGAGPCAGDRAAARNRRRGRPHSDKASPHFSFR